MIFIYGDSHARFSFKNLNMPHKNYSCDSITMFRTGRDNTIINFKNEHDSNSTLCFVYGEVDCRCHIKRQILLGNSEDAVIYDLIDKYFKSIKTNVTVYKKIVIVAIIPPTRQEDYEKLHGPITHEYPFVGTDNERVRFTGKANKLIESLCIRNGYTFFNPYHNYTREDGTLKHELSDLCVHVGNNQMFLKEFNDSVLI
jgi:hypothetical protein